MSKYQEYAKIQELQDKHPIWSGHGGYLSIPSISDTVYVGMNNIGNAVVKKYFIEDGYFGVKDIPKNPPQWYIEQNGAELKYLSV